MRAVDVRIRQDADAAIAQARQVGTVVLAMRVDADRDRDVVDLVIGEQAVALGFPGNQLGDAQLQEGLDFVGAELLGRAGGEGGEVM
jgi:hypothetical protein